jgi:hypothetical protein
MPRRIQFGTVEFGSGRSTEARLGATKAGGIEFSTESSVADPAEPGFTWFVRLSAGRTGDAGTLAVPCQRFRIPVVLLPLLALFPAPTSSDSSSSLPACAAWEIETLTGIVDRREVLLLVGRFSASPHSSARRRSNPLRRSA